MARALADHLVSARERFISTAARPLAFTFLFLGIIAVATGWVFASSPGSSPDDDYHLVSTWCPRPVDSSCETTMIDGDRYVMAPLTASRSVCEAFHPDRSHACIKEYSDDAAYPSYRYDDGLYPLGFYHFHHLFAGHNVERSAWHMRVANVVILLILIGAITVLSQREVRVNIALAALVAWTPMGMYFIASNNPSSWAITGVFCYGAALYAGLNARGWRHWALLGVACLSALLCYESRGDASFYVFVASLGILILEARRRHLPEIGFATVLSAIGVWLMLGSGQASSASQSSDATITVHDRIDVAFTNLRYLPDYFAGFVGLNSGPGWRDTSLPGYAPVVALLVLGFVIFLGARAMSWRKALASIMVFGAMAGIPILVATPTAFPNLGAYHTRYTLPLLGVLLLIWVSSAVKKSSLTKGQFTFFVVFLSVVNAVAMHTTIARYVRGLLWIPHIGWIAPVNLNGDIQWWWADMSLSPMTLWGLASLGYTLALTSAIYLLRHRQVEAPVSSTPTEEEEPA